jgi:hypothetical protein
MQWWIVVVLSCFFTATVHAAAPRELTGREYSETQLLLSQTDFEVRLAAKSLYRLGSDRQSILDLAAEVTWTACSGNRRMDPDTLSWLAKALGRSRQARYAVLLDYCLASTTDKKIIKYLTEAKASLEGTATGSFEGGKMDLGRMRDRLPKQGGSTLGKQAAKQFDALRKDRSLDEVYSMFGTPDDVNGVNMQGRKVGHIVNVRTSGDMIVFEYNSLGTIRFVYSEAKSNWLLAEAKGDRGLIWGRHGGRFVTFDELITDGDEPQLRDVLRQLEKRHPIERATLDRIADRIYQSRLDPDDTLADTLARLCWVLARSGDGRYKPLLLEVSDTAAERTLRKHAGKAANELPDTTEEKYVPSLAGK